LLHPSVPLDIKPAASRGLSAVNGALTASTVAYFLVLREPFQPLRGSRRRPSSAPAENDADSDSADDDDDNNVDDDNGCEDNADGDSRAYRASRRCSDPTSLEKPAPTIRALAFGRRTNASCSLSASEAAIKRVVVCGNVAQWPLPVLFWALLDSSHGLLPLVHPIRVLFIVFVFVYLFCVCSFVLLGMTSRFFIALCCEHSALLRACFGIASSALPRALQA
jgi:hypothetical protein